MIISSAFGWFAGIRGINSFFWRFFAGLLAVIVLSSFLGFGVHTYLNRDEARYGKVDVFVGGRKAVQAALIIYQLKGQDALVVRRQSLHSALSKRIPSQRLKTTSLRTIRSTP